MARFSETLTLRKAVTEVSDTGAVKTDWEDSEVFFNRYRLSLSNRLAGAADGLKGMVTGQIRTADYDGQQIALLNGQEYTVTDANDSGDFTAITLSERLGND